MQEFNKITKMLKSNALVLEYKLNNSWKEKNSEIAKLN